MNNLPNPLTFKEKICTINVMVNQGLIIKIYEKVADGKMGFK